MHVDETDDPYWHTLELLAEKTIETGYQGRVTAAHCCAMAAWDEKLFQRILSKLVEAQVNICTNTPVNLIIQGRECGHPVRRGIARVKDLLEAGVNVTCGQDDLQNMFYPFGNMDMLSVTNFVAHAAHMSSETEIKEAFDMPRYRAAKVLGLDGYGLLEGSEANLVLFQATSAADALRKQPERTFVIRKGEILVQSERTLTLSPSLPFAQVSEVKN
jgi:cytosine deaminase